MKNLFFLLFCSSFLLLFSTKNYAHEYHVSIMQVSYNTQNKSLEISIKLFTDDLERVLEHKNDTLLRIGTAKENSSLDNYINTYLQENLKLKVNGETLPMTFLGKEVEAHETWCYLEISDLTVINYIEILNSVFSETFSDQQNRVNFEINNLQKSVFLHAKKYSDKLTF